MKLTKRFGWFGVTLLVFLACIGIQFGATIGVILMISILAGVKAGMQGITDPDEITVLVNQMTGNVTPVCMIATQVLLILVFSLWYRFGCGKPSLKKVNKQELLSPKGILTIALFGVGMNVLANCGLPLAAYVIPESIMENYEALMQNAGVGDNWITNLAAVFMAPFGEELFRGVTLFYCGKMVAGMKNKKAAFWIANCVQALWFGVMHLNLVQGCYAFLLGLGLGYLVYRFKSIIPSIAGHMIFNGLSCFVWSPLAETLPETNAFYITGTMVGVILLMVAVYSNRTCSNKMLEEKAVAV